jgi:hypothetical protein
LGLLAVDGVTTTHDPSLTALSPHSQVDLTEPLYIGSHPDIAVRNTHTGMDATKKIQGCLSSLNIDHHYDLSKQHFGNP